MKLSFRPLAKQLEPLTLFKMTAKLFATVAIALVAFTLYLLVTPSGAKLSLSFLSELTPYQIEVKEVTGCLLEDLELKEVTLIGPDFNAKADVVQFEWDFIQLFQPQKKIQSFKAANITLNINNFVQNSATIKTTEKTEKNGKKRLSNQQLMTSIQNIISSTLPIALEVENIHIQNATVHWQQSSHHIDELILKHALSTDFAMLQDISYQGSFGQLNIAIREDIKAKWDLNLSANTFLADYFTGNVTTKGQMILPHKLLHSSDNQIDITLNATQILLHDKQTLQDVKLSLKGSLAAHDAIFSGLFNGNPISTTLNGKLGNDQWMGSISHFEVKHERWQKMGKTSGKLKIDWQDKKTIFSALEFSLWDKTPVQVDFNISKKKPYAVSGILKSEIEDLKSLAVLIPDFAKLRGKLLVNLKLAGNLSHIDWTGDITMKEAKLRAKSLGSKAYLNQLHFAVLKDNQIHVDGQGTWGSGPFTIAGQGTWQQTVPNLVIHFKGENLLLSDTPEYYIVANPDLTLTLRDGNPKIEGKIFIPEAEIQSLKNPDLISPSHDVIIVSNKKTEQKPLSERHFVTQLTTDVKILLGEKITYKGHGVTTQVKGKLHVQQYNGQLPKAKGKLILHNGKYRGFGKKFDIDYGQILFAGGPIYDPILDIRAKRTIQPNNNLSTLHQGQTITAGIKFTGNLKSPKMAMYSTPNMSDADIISYLVVGRPQSQINDAQAELLFEAVSQLTHIVSNSRSDVQFDLAEQFKLDQIGFSKRVNDLKKPNAHSTNPLDDTVFYLGKQLSSKLYMQYSIGLLDSANNVGLRYLLSKNLTVEASAGSQGSSADLLLSLEGN